MIDNCFIYVVLELGHLWQGQHLLSIPHCSWESDSELLSWNAVILLAQCCLVGNSRNCTKTNDWNDIIKSGWRMTRKYIVDPESFISSVNLECFSLDACWLQLGQVSLILQYSIPSQLLSKWSTLHLGLDSRNESNINLLLVLSDALTYFWNTYPFSRTWPSLTNPSIIAHLELPLTRRWWGASLNCWIYSGEDIFTALLSNLY